MNYINQTNIKKIKNKQPRSNQIKPDQINQIKHLKMNKHLIYNIDDNLSKHLGDVF
jgi:hypothetical protein